MTKNVPSCIGMVETAVGVGGRGMNMVGAELEVIEHLTGLGVGALELTGGAGGVNLAVDEQR